MNYLLVYLLLFFSFSPVSWAKDRTFQNLDKADLEEIESDVLLNDSIIERQATDEMSGIALKSYSTKDDSGRFSFLYHVNASVGNFSNISGFEFILANRYDWGWIEYSVVRTSTKMQNVTVYNTNINTPQDGLYEETHTITELGVGLNYRSKYIQHLLESNALFETVGASLEYVSFTDNYFEESFNGFGIKADFGLHYRGSKAFHYGLKMATHLATVKKSETVAGESDTTRALFLRWITLGVDLTFYY